jgi:glycosyltransferase involved in cell wall biosynthesis
MGEKCPMMEIERKKDERIAILLTTYNSAKYLRLQLDSLVAQTEQNWMLYIRDDGSTDETRNIIQEYVALHPRITFLQDSEKNMGAMKSVRFLLSVVKAKYYMFCDHDDYWLENKIELSKEAIKALDAEHPETPIIVHTDLYVVDDQLRVKHDSFWRYSKIKPDILANKEMMQVFNCVTGCTMIFNDRAKQISFPYPDNAPMHDWWIALKVVQSGIIHHLQTPTIYYRQHDNNEVGARDINKRYFLNKLLGVKETLAGQRKQIEFLKSINGHSFFKYYYYKAIYTIIRNT